MFALSRVEVDSGMESVLVLVWRWFVVVYFVVSFGIPARNFEELDVLWHDTFDEDKEERELYISVPIFFFTFYVHIKKHTQAENIIYLSLTRSEIKDNSCTRPLGLFIVFNGIQVSVTTVT